LYVMFLVAVVAIFTTGFYISPESSGEPVSVSTIVRVMLLLFGVSTIFALLVLLPNLTQGNGGRLLDRFCRRVPRVKSLVLAVQEYRNHKRMLLASGLMTVLVHLLFSLGIWLIALGFFGFAPSAADHLVLHPVANVTQMIPLSLGPYEAVLDNMYTIFSIAGHDSYKVGYGLVIALGYRIISLLLGGAGALFYLCSGRSQK